MSRRLLSAILVCALLIVPTWVSARSASPPGVRLYLASQAIPDRLLPIDPLSLQDLAHTPPITLSDPSLPSVSPSILPSANGSTLAIVYYRDTNGAPLTPQDITVRVLDAHTGTERTRFHPAVPLIIEGISTDGRELWGMRTHLARTATLGWTVADGWYLLDAATGEIAAELPLDVPGWMPMLFDPALDRFYMLDESLLTPDHREGRRPPYLLAYDLHTEQRVGLQVLDGVKAGQWKTGRKVKGLPIYAS